MSLLFNLRSELTRMKNYEITFARGKRSPVPRGTQLPALLLHVLQHPLRDTNPCRREKGPWLLLTMILGHRSYWSYFTNVGPECLVTCLR